MREHLYKAKRTDNGEWYEGASLMLWYITPENEANGVYGKAALVKRGSTSEHRTYSDGSETTTVEAVYVDPSTVCEFSGLLDKNGKKIFDGDKLLNTTFGDIWTVEFIKGCFMIELYDDGTTEYLANVIGFEVIGSIHDKE